jgi:hypothetical protein
MQKSARISRRRQRRRIAGIFVSGLIALGGVTFSPTYSDAQTTNVPLAVETIDIGESSISFHVTNTGPAAITAYAVEVQVPLIDGKVVAYAREVDGYPVAHERPLLQPGQSRQMSSSLPAQFVPSGIKVIPKAAVFDDLTSAGDPSAVEGILNKRRRERDDLLHWLTALKQSLIRHSDNLPVTQYAPGTLSQLHADELTSQISLTQKMQAFDEFSRELAGAPQSRIAGSIRDSIAVLSTIDRAERDAKIQLFMQILEQQYANSVKHSGRAQ